MLADASSTTAVGSQSCCATSTATSATRYVAVSVAKSARFPRSVSWAVSCSIWPRTSVSCAWTSRTSEILIALAAMAWSADSLARRFRIRAARSTIWPVTSTASVFSVMTFVVRPFRPRSAASASSQRSTGMR